MTEEEGGAGSKHPWACGKRLQSSSANVDVMSAVWGADALMMCSQGPRLGNLPFPEGQVEVTGCHHIRSLPPIQQVLQRLPSWLLKVIWIRTLLKVLNCSLKRMISNYYSEVLCCRGSSQCSWNLSMFFCNHTQNILTWPHTQEGTQAAKGCRELHHPSSPGCHSVFFRDVRRSHSPCVSAYSGTVVRMCWATCLLKNPSPT